MRRKFNRVLELQRSTSSIQDWHSRCRIASHSDLNYLLVINPHNGPGISPLSDSNYIREVTKLNSIPNVCTVGYVKVDYCRRDLTEVYRDIEIFAGWSKDFATTGLGVHGVFFDESPNEHSEHVARYLDRIRLKVKSIEGMMGDRLVSKCRSNA